MQRLTIALLCALMACMLAGTVAKPAADLSLVESDALLEAELEHELAQEAENMEEEEADEEEEQSEEEQDEEEEESDEAQDILAELDAPADADAGMETFEENAEISSEEANEVANLMEEAAAEVDSQKVDVSDTTLHEQYLPFTQPMELLSESLAETHAQVKGDGDGDGDGGKNPTYILPVDPFNYYPFFNGFSNVNPFSQFYPPPPYLYPQYVNHMQRYASRSNPTPPPYPGSNYPTNYPAPFPHLYYPFGAYKLDTNGPDIPSGSNSPEPFPQFVEETSTVRPHILTEDSPFRHPEQEETNNAKMSGEEGIEVEGGNLHEDEQVFVTDVEYSD